jgi:hypothetical protein
MSNDEIKKYIQNDKKKIAIKRMISNLKKQKTNERMDNFGLTGQIEKKN